ncbi:antibiotic biosynthesis monooxygenase family protein [Cohaesibacter gelatinilyticus]|uniref:Heme-degrading monooxygenase HmoA n=1 Tax=Cohaesibacter gelatinilyticus TaxID=372072 RepID=A0A285PFW7_9HYPH|nr:antibiotic biosynthesis monooxygenase [Cohaesibacter gelatinilyticus]SNZ20599.1 Heme-degrading monooxygenase HmoA [Cohaesibacter gelatinilyticus]
MFIAMNHFLVKPGYEEAFEGIWRDRDSRLREFDGFISFEMLKAGEQEDGFVLYASHATWNDREAFEVWLNSDHFKSSHGRPKVKVEYKGPPRFIGFETLENLSISALEPA